MLQRWHTLPKNEKLPVPKEPFDIPVDSSEFAYDRATSTQKDVLDRLGRHLKDVHYIPPISYDQLYYKYKNNYGNTEPPFSNYQRLFVYVVSWNALYNAATATQFEWDKEDTPMDKPVDCRGRTYVVYSDHTKDFGSGENCNRDPIHNWGIIEERDYIQGTDMVIRRIWACCGLPEKNPGCWLGPVKYKVEPYQVAPNFAQTVWGEMLKRPADKKAIEDLWNNEESIKGTVWIHEKYYNDLHERIQAKKPKMAGVIYKILKDQYDKKSLDENHQVLISNIYYTQFQQLVEEYNTIYCEKDSGDILKLESVGRKVWTKDEFVGILIDDGKGGTKRVKILEGVGTWDQFKISPVLTNAINSTKQSDAIKTNVIKILNGMQTNAALMNTYVTTQKKIDNIPINTIPQFILRKELESTVLTVIPDNASSYVTQVRAYIKTLGVNFDKDKVNIDPLDDISDSLTKEVNETKKIFDNNEINYDIVEEKFYIIEKHKNDSIIYNPIENNIRNEYNKNFKELIDTSKEENDLDNPSQERDEYKTKYKQFQEKYENMNKTYGPIVKSFQDKSVKWSKDFEDFNQDILKKYQNLQKEWEILYPKIKQKLDKRIKEHKEAKILKANKEAEEKARESAENDVKGLQLDDIETQIKLDVNGKKTRMNKIANIIDYLEKQILLDIKGTKKQDLLKVMQYIPDNNFPQVRLFAQERKKLFEDMLYYVKVDKAGNISTNGKDIYLRDAAQKVADALQKLVEELGKVKQEDEKKNQEKLIKENANKWAFLPDDTRNWIKSKDLQSLILGSDKALTLLKQWIDLNSPVIEAEFNDIKNIVRLDNNQTIPETNDYSKSNRVYVQNWTKKDIETKWTLFMLSLVSIPYTKGSSKALPQPQPTKIEVNDISWPVKTNKTLPEVDSTIPSMFEYNMIQWKENSCWLDSVFLSLFGYVGSPISREIYEKGKIISEGKKIYFPSGKPIEYPGKCTPDELQTLHNTIVDDIYNIQKEKEFCRLKTVIDWEKCLPIRLARDPGGFGGLDTVLGGLLYLYELKSLTLQQKDNIILQDVTKDTKVHVALLTDRDTFDDATNIIAPYFQQGDFLCSAIIGHNGAHFATYMYDYYTGNWVFVNVSTGEQTGIIDPTKRYVLDSYLPEYLFKFKDPQNEFKPWGFVFYRKSVIEEILNKKDKAPKPDFKNYTRVVALDKWVIPAQFNEIVTANNFTANFADPVVKRYGKTVGLTEKNQRVIISEGLAKAPHTYALYYFNEYMRNNTIDVELKIIKAMGAVLLDYKDSEALGIQPVKFEGTNLKTLEQYKNLKEDKDKLNAIKTLQKFRKLK